MPGPTVRNTPRGLRPTRNRGRVLGNGPATTAPANTSSPQLRQEQTRHRAYVSKYRGKRQKTLNRLAKSTSLKFDIPKGTGTGRKTDPRQAALTEFLKNRREGAVKQSSVSHDELAQLVQDTIVTAGVGTGGKLAVKGAIAAGGKLLAKKGAEEAATVAKGAGEVAAERAPKAAQQATTKLEKVKKPTGAKPPKITRTIKTPKARVQTAVAKTAGAPGRAANEAKALATSEGRKLAGMKVTRGALSHPVLGGTAALALAHRAGVPVPGGKQADALITGTAKAITSDPAKTAFTTARALPAAITAPVALGGSAIQSAQAGSLGPLKQEAKSQFEGAFWKPGPKRGLAEAMLSGDPNVVEKTVKRKGGAALLLPLPALTKTHAYEAARTGVREAGATARRRIAKNAPEDSKRAKVRHEPKGVNPPEPLFALTARHGQRKRVAVSKQRKDNPQQVAAHRHERNVTNPLRKRQAPKDAGKIVQPAVEYGIRDAKSAKFVREHDPVVAHDPQLRAALDLIDKHPDFYEKTYGRKSVDAGVVASRGNQAARAGVGDRARVMAQARVLRSAGGKNHDPALLDPVNMVPHKARAFTKATTRDGAWKELGARGAKIHDLRSKASKADERIKIADSGIQAAREKLITARHGQGTVRGNQRYAQALEALKQARTRRDQIVTERNDYRNQLRTEAKKLSGKNKSLYDALAPYTRPGQAAESEARLPYDKSMVKEHANAVDAAAKDVGLARAEYTHHASVHHPGVGLEPSSFQTPVSRKEHMRSNEAKLEMQGKLDRSLPAFIEGTIHQPRRREGGKQLMRSIARDEKVSYTWDGKKVENGVVPNAEVYAAITSPKTKENPNGGQVDEKSVARLPLREVKNAEADPFAPGAKDPGQILADMEAGRIRGHEPAVLVHRESLKELKAQQQGPSGIIRGLGKASSVASRTILFTPAWEKAQIVAEGIPILMSHPEIALRPAKTAKMLKDFHAYVKSHPEEAAALEGTAGAVPSGSRASAIQNPAELHGGYNLNLDTFDKGGRALTRGWGWQALSDLAHLKTLGLFDVARMNEYRRVVALAEADKRFRTFRGGLSGLIKKEQELSHAFRGKSREEMYNWLSRDPKGKKAMAEIADHTDNVLGNWSAFTRFEKDFAPFTIFYPFFRYAIRWPLWTFPREHPVTAGITYFLAQQNANQVEKILGGRPANILDYAKPVYTTSQKNPKKPGTFKQAVLPGGTRISPGQSPLQGAAATGDVGQLLSAANPAIGAGITLLTGKGPFGTDVKGGRGWAIADQLIGLTPVARAAPLLGLNPIKSQNILHKAGIGKAAPAPSLFSKMFQALDPNRTARSILAPEIPLGATKFKQQNELTQALQRITDNSKAEQSKVRSSWTGSTKDLGVRIRQMKLLAAEGDAKIKQIAIDLGFNGDEIYQQQKYYHRAYGSPAPQKSLLKRSD